MKKITIFSFLTLLAFVLLGTQTTYANTNNQININHNLPNVPQQLAKYDHNGFQYTLSTSGDTLMASLITENPEEIEYIVVYNNIMDFPVMYTSITDLSSYTNLKDVIIFEQPRHFGGLYNFEGTIQNLYLGHGNHLDESFENLNITNYHFVTPYFNYYTEFDKSNGKAKIDEMNFSNGYYYDFTKDVFEKGLADYNTRSNKKHNFILKSNSTLKYTIESFLPSKDFQLRYSKAGVDYEVDTYMEKHKLYKSYLDMKANIIKIDQRVKSFHGAKLIRGIEPLRNIEFKTLDLRGLEGLTQLQNIKAETLYLSNKGDTFNNNQTIYVDDLYFVADELATPVGNVFGSYPNIKNVHIPNDNKELFQTIIDSDDFSSKIKYYTNLIPTYNIFEFTNDEGDKLYKSSDDYIDIDTILNSIEEFETLTGVDLEKFYVNQILELYNFPIYAENSGRSVEAYPIIPSTIHLNIGMDPRTVLETIVEDMVAGEYETVEITFEDEDFELDKDGDLVIKVTINERLSQISRVDILYYDFKEVVSFIKFYESMFVLTNISDTKTLEDLIDIYNEHVEDPRGEAVVNKNHDLKIEKKVLSSYENDWDSNVIRLFVTNDNIGEKQVYYELPDSFVFTENIDIEKAITVLHKEMLFKDDLLSNEAYILEITVKSAVINLKGEFPNEKEFDLDIPYTVIESEIGEYLIAKHNNSNTFILYVEAGTIKEDVNAQSILDSYFENKQLEDYIDQYKLPITLTRKGELTKTIELEETEEEFTVKVVVTNKDLNPEGFEDPFKTKKDEFGSSSILDQIKDKFAENDALKWSSIVVSSLLGIGLIYLVYLFIRKFIKWIRK
ncbi:hypothetical protein [Haploplasma modicum]|uniref:hypothetical protein n=1 Tax=Haploplasma modicum TaxID=2150 RepID=UPI0004796417|nr:hypothetical protein [Haploplasma modicum]